MPDPLQRIKKVCHGLKAQQPFAKLSLVPGPRLPAAIIHPAPGNTSRSPIAIFLPGRTSARHSFSPAGFGQHHFDAPCRLLLFAPQRPPRIEPRRNHAAVIQHQQIAGPQQGRELAELRIAKIPGRAIHHQHAALSAFRRRLLRNQFVAEVQSRSR